MKWNYYSKRRNVSLASFIKGRNVESYENLTEVLALQGIEPPEFSMFQSAYAIAFPPPPKARKRPAPKKSTAPKSTTSKSEIKPIPAKRKRTSRKK